MKRRDFIASVATCTAGLSLLQFESLLAATGFHDDGPYNGPLLTDTITTTCGACPGGCGLRIQRADKIPFKVEGNPTHPVNRGGLCPVGAASLGLLVHPDRVKQPLLRTGPRGSGEYNAISWDEAARLMREKLATLRDGGTPERLLILDSTQSGPGKNLVDQWARDFGTPNLYRDGNPADEMAATVWGGEGTHTIYDLENARVIFCFGHPIFEAGRNPVYFAGLRGRLLSRGEGQKGRFIVIDSRLSASAAKAERWIPIQPGTHGLLALGLMYLIVKEDLYDRSVVDRYCEGFEDWTTSSGRRVEGFKTHLLRNYSPAVVSKYTGLPVDQIIALARLMATTAGAVAIPGSGVSETVDGIYQTWAIMALNFLTGRVGTAGGVHAFSPDPSTPPPWTRSGANSLVSQTPAQFPYLAGRGAIESLPEQILSQTPYPIEVAIFRSVNPVYDSSQPDRFRQALQNIPFSIACTTLQNETSLVADLVLPECTFFEKHDLITPDSHLPHAVVSLMQPVIKPLYESRQSDDVLLQLGRDLMGGAWTSWNSYRSYLEFRMNEMYQSSKGSLFTDEFKVSFQSLLAERGWRRKEYPNFESYEEALRVAGGWWDPTEVSDRGLSGCPTSSGKFYFVSRPLEAKYSRSKDDLHGLLQNAGLEAGDGTEHYLGAYRNFERGDEEQYPLRLHPFELTTLRGEGGRMDKMADMVGYYQNVKWDIWVELNPELAHELHLKDGQAVWVESKAGRMRMRLVINPGLAEHVAALPVGMGKSGTHSFGKNIRAILGPARDCFTGSPTAYESRVRVYAAT